tara:strand:+ start:45 stop:626 length:582 start_codon:yes stop_codon:yes gene_type:complete
MSKIEIWFPTCIYIEDNLLSNDEKENLINKCYEIKKNTNKGGNHWISNVYNTQGTYNISEDINFKLLKNKITDHVNAFAKLFETTNIYSTNDGWLNVYKKTDYQESHFHSGSIFSVVYFLSAPKGSGNILFNSPNPPDMLPIENIKKNTYINSGVVSYEAIENRLMIFRSSLIHSVLNGTNKTDRISLAFNFK